MLADEAAGVLAGGAGLGAEAGAEGAVAEGQLLAVEDLVGVVVGDRHLGGGDEEALVAPRGLEEVLLELGELAGARQRRADDEVGREQLGVPALGVHVDHEGHQRPLQPRQRAPVEDEARAGDLGRALEVEHPRASRRARSAASG